MLKCSIERCVCAPHNLSAGTRISPMLSTSLRISMIWAPLPPMRTLVLLPGFMCDADLWTDMVPDLGKIGHLHYGNVYADDTLEGMARRVLDEAPDTFVLVGFSMGGFVARVLTLMAPERVAGVAFVATSAREYTMEERERRRQGLLPGNRPKANGNAGPPSRPRPRSGAARPAARHAAAAGARGAQAPVRADQQGRL